MKIKLTIYWLSEDSTSLDNIVMINLKAMSHSENLCCQLMFETECFEGFSAEPHVSDVKLLPKVLPARSQLQLEHLGPSSPENLGPDPGHSDTWRQDTWHVSGQARGW